MNLTETCDKIFDQAIQQYHLNDDVDFTMPAPYEGGSFEMLLFHKSWIDTVQWHLEDIIRNPAIDPVEALKIKRRIDASNQDRTDKVEYIDSYFFDKFKNIKLAQGANLNTETIAWAIDRYSILFLKIYHMNVEANRSDSSESQKNGCQEKLNVLLQQKQDLAGAITQLVSDLESGHKIMKMYKQMKMYNDPALNPVLYAKK